MSPTKNLLNPHQVAEVLRLDITTVYRLLNQKKLPEYRIGGEWHIEREALKLAMEQTDHIRKRKRRKRQ